MLPVSPAPRHGTGHGNTYYYCVLYCDVCGACKLHWDCMLCRSTLCDTTSCDMCQQPLLLLECCLERCTAQCS
eukprot:4671-Heterococcus_DN1.PRE.1